MTVAVEQRSLVLRLGADAAPLNLTHVPLTDRTRLAFRAAPARPTPMSITAR